MTARRSYSAPDISFEKVNRIKINFPVVKPYISG